MRYKSFSLCKFVANCENFNIQIWININGILPL